MTAPSPLTPPDCDLRDFAFLPLDVVRLRDSDLVALESAEAFRAAVLLWCASWHQVPAGSLPDDDRVLANLAGYGRVVKEWQKEREGALRGWVVCADGRLYHPVVAEKAAEAWRGKLERQWRTECARIKKHGQRHGVSLNVPEFDAWLSAGRPQGHALDVPGDKQNLSSGTGGTGPGSVLGETGSKGQGEGKGEGQGQGQGQTTPSSLRSEGGASAPPPPPGTPAPPAPPPSPPAVKARREAVVLSAYLTLCRTEQRKPVPDDHFIRSWCTDAGIGPEMLQVAWLLFKERYTEGEKGKGKRYKDWPAHFATAVKSNWFKLWMVGDDSKPVWSSVGLTHKAVLDARMSKRIGEGGHA